MKQALNRKQSIVYFSDIVGYTLLMGQNEDQAFELMKQNLELHKRILDRYNGTVIKELGDGILATFETASEALAASLEIQNEWIKTGKLKLRIGLHCGGIILDHGDVFGDAVNVASRVQSIGVPSCVLFSSKVLEQLPQISKLTHVSLGAFRLKNVAKKLEIYALSNTPLAIPKRKDMINTIKTQEKEPWKFWVGLGVAVLLSIFLIFSLLWNDYTWEKDKSVAVLPFEIIGVQDGQDIYSKDLTEEIINQLSEVNDIKVISYNTISEYTDSNINLDSLAKVLEVKTILRGTILYLKDMTKVDVQLIDIEENKNLWTESFNRSGKDLLSVQSEIAKEISRVLGISLSAKEEAEIGKVLTSYPEAFDWYLKAKEHYTQYDSENLQLAANYYRKAIAIDQNFTSAYAGLANSFAKLAEEGGEHSWNDSSLAISEIGLQIDPNNAELYKSRGNVYYNLGKIENAQNSFEKAVSLKANYSQAIGNLATIHFAKGNLSESLLGQLKSATLDPTNPYPYFTAGWIFRILNQNQEAIKWFDKALKLVNDPYIYSLKATAYIAENRVAEAMELLPQTQTSTPEYSNYESAGLIYFFTGNLPEAKTNYTYSIQNHADFTKDEYFVAPINLAYILMQNGEKLLADSLLNGAIKLRMDAIEGENNDYNIRLDLASAMAIKKLDSECLKYLQQAVDLGWRDLFFVTYNPIFDHMSVNSRFKDIIDQVQQKLNQEAQAIEDK